MGQNRTENVNSAIEMGNFLADQELQIPVPEVRPETVVGGNRKRYIQSISNISGTPQSVVLKKRLLINTRGQSKNSQREELDETSLKAGQQVIYEACRVKTPISVSRKQDWYKAVQEHKQTCKDEERNFTQQLFTMKNFYTNRNFNFIKLFTKNSKDVEYKFRFNQDVFNKRHIDPNLTAPSSTINNTKQASVF